MVDYLFQILMRPGTTEYALFQLFAIGIRSKYGLNNLLNSEDFKVEFTIIFGDIDWVKELDSGASELLIELK